MSLIIGTWPYIVLLLCGKQNKFERNIYSRRISSIFGDFVAIVDHITHFYWSGIAKRKNKASLDNFKESEKFKS